MRIMRKLCERKTFASNPLDIRARRRQGLGRTFEGRERYQAAVTRRLTTVRVLVVVLLGLVVVLAALTELCLLQAASMRRKLRAVLPPEDTEDR
jgi:hypothetical protein